jgi:hypothetical protein
VLGDYTTRPLAGGAYSDSLRRFSSWTIAERSGIDKALQELFEFHGSILIRLKERRDSVTLEPLGNDPHGFHPVLVGAQDAISAIRVVCYDSLIEVFVFFRGIPPVAAEMPCKALCLEFNREGA